MVELQGVGLTLFGLFNSVYISYLSQSWVFVLLSFSWVKKNEILIVMAARKKITFVSKSQISMA